MAMPFGSYPNRRRTRVQRIIGLGVCIGMLVFAGGIPVLPASAVVNIDPYVSAVSITRVANATNPENYDYDGYASFLNQGGNDYTENWNVTFVLFNNPGIQAMKYTLPAWITLNLLGGNHAEDAIFVSLPPAEFDNLSYYCCADVTLVPSSTNQNDDTSNDHKANNTLNLAVVPSQKAYGHLAVYNGLADAVTFDASIVDLPEGWIMHLDSWDITIGPGEQGYVDFDFTPPGIITEWPHFQVWFNGRETPDADQMTDVWTRDGTIFATPCGEAILL